MHTMKAQVKAERLPMHIKGQQQQLMPDVSQVQLSNRQIEEATMLMNMNLNRSIEQDKLRAKDYTYFRTQDGQFLPNLAMSPQGNVILANPEFDQETRDKVMIQLIGIMGDQNNNVGWNGDETLKKTDAPSIFGQTKRDGESAFNKYVNQETGMRRTGMQTSDRQKKEHVPADKKPSNLTDVGAILNL